jgi:hypothetical protein
MREHPPETPKFLVAQDAVSTSLWCRLCNGGRWIGVEPVVVDSEVQHLSDHGQDAIRHDWSAFGDTFY